MFSYRAWVLLAAALAVSASGCGGADGVTIQGCGATFPAPLYQRWFLEYYLKHPDVRVNYQAIGSGAGIQQFRRGLVHFGASDEALKEADLKKIAKELNELEERSKERAVEVVQIPMTGGSVAICYNLPGKPALKLTRKAYVDMLLGNITRWDDEAIRATNPDVQLPHLEMTFIRRADSSGTTFVFTSHLHAADPKRWPEKMASKTPDWPIGIGGKGNAGVSALIQQTPGSFGYIEEGYAKLVKLPMAELQNQAGKFVAPAPEAAREALQEAKFDAVLGARVSDPKGAGAYPIVSLTWVVCRKQYDDPEVADKLRDVLTYCLATEAGKGQALSNDLHYVPMPDEAITKARRAIAEIKGY